MQKPTKKAPKAILLLGLYFYFKLKVKTKMIIKN